MVIVNLYFQEDYNPETDGFDVFLAAVVNDYFDIQVDPELIMEAIQNDPNFEPKNGQFYEVQLIRGTIASDPVPEPGWAIDRVIEKVYNSHGEWETPLVRM